jgi:hypothetical protein
MTQKLDRIQIGEVARLVASPATQAPAVAHPPRSFELPARLYGLTVAAYLAFLAVTALGFASPGLIIPIAICAIYIAMAFGTPRMWTRTRREGAEPGLSWPEFRRSGIATATGRLDAAEASVQVLILPVVVLAWGVATVVLFKVLG